MTIEELDNRILQPDPVERSPAEKLGRALAERLAQGEAIEVILSDDEPGARQSLPVTASKLLVKILAEIAKGNALKVVALKPELKIQEAAELLSVSRPHLTTLLEQGELPSHQVGEHRRIRLADVLSYRRKNLEE